jgi:hypothetical protein
MQPTRTAADRLQIGTLEVVHVAQDESMVKERNDGGMEPRQNHEIILSTRFGAIQRPFTGRVA